MTGQIGSRMRDQGVRIEISPLSPKNSGGEKSKRLPLQGRGVVLVARQVPGLLFFCGR